MTAENAPNCVAGRPRVLRATTRLLERHLNLASGAEPGNARSTLGAYAFWGVHVRSVLVAAEVPGPDAIVDLLLAPLALEVTGTSGLAA